MARLDPVATAVLSTRQTMNPPAVSVAIPLYNKAPYIAATVRSALAQSFADFEIIVVDDGSTDHGAGQLRDLADGRLVTVWQENSGVSAARNRAMREGRARYVAFLDADDLWHPDHLAHLMELAGRFPNAVLLGNAFAAVTKSDVPSAAPVLPVNYRLVEDYFAECVSSHAPLHTSSCMVLRARALALGGFPVGSYCGEDLALWIRLAADAPVAVSNFIGCHYRRGIDSLSWNPSYRNAPDISMRALEEILERPAWPPHRKVAVREYHSRLALAHCLDCLRAGEREQAREYLRLASGSRRLRRRVWQARMLDLLPSPLRSWVFQLAELRRDWRRFNGNVGRA
jgi:glycosyltransferase involved in cell wall biosynthesis